METEDEADGDADHRIPAVLTLSDGTAEAKEARLAAATATPALILSELCNLGLILSGPSFFCCGWLGLAALLSLWIKIGPMVQPYSRWASYS